MRSSSGLGRRLEPTPRMVGSARVLDANRRSHSYADFFLPIGRKKSRDDALGQRVCYCVKHSKRGTTLFRLLRARNISTRLAAAAAAHHRRWWAMAKHGALLYSLSRFNKRLDRFTLRGRTKVNGQWLLFCLVHNIEKLTHAGYAASITRRERCARSRMAHASRGSIVYQCRIE